MVMFVSKRNNRILQADNMSGESFVHDCSDRDDSESKEDVVIISSTVEDNGTEISTGKLKGDIHWQGVANKIGQRGLVNGEKSKVSTSRGNNAQTTRERTYYEYINNVKGGY